MAPDASANFNILQKMGIPLTLIGEASPLSQHLKNGDLIVDALFGTGLSRDLDEFWQGVIAGVNEAGKPVISVDIPSGLNTDTGIKMPACVRAVKTVALGLPKKGFYLGAGPECCGIVSVADISLPKQLLEEFQDKAE